MILSYLKLTNFTSYRQEIINFKELPSNATIAIFGPNGNGKSSIIDAITTCLFNRARGTTSQGTGLENLITKGEDKLEVELEFEIDNQVVRVIRRRFLKGGQELELYIDGVDHTDKIKETQTKLLSIIRMDYETFIDSVVITQGNSGSFMEKPANERKEVFTQILNLDKYDVLQEYTKELRKETKRKIGEKESKLEELADSIKLKEQYEEALENGKKQISFLENEISIKEFELETELAEKAKHEQLVKQQDDILRRQRTLKDRVESTKESIKKGKILKEKCEAIILSKENVFSSLEEFTQKLEQLNEQRTILSSRKSELEGTNTALRKQAKELKTKHDRMKEFNEANCSFCGQEVTEEHKAKHLQDLFNEASGYIKQIKTNESTIQELENELSKNNLDSSSIRQNVQNLQNQKSQIEQAEVKLSTIVTRLEELHNDLISYEQEYKEAMQVEVVEVENKVFNDFQLRNELQSLRQQLMTWTNKVAVSENEIKKIEKDEEKVLQIDQEIKDLQSHYSKLDDLTIAWGKNGIQAIIIDNALPEIEDEINDILELLTDGQVTIEFVTQKEKGKGKNATSIETLDIIVNDQDGSRTYETYSGGEKFRIDFACHVGLSKFLSKRAGAAIDFFIVDEGVGSQDVRAKENFVNVMHKISTIFDKTFIITHIDDIIESFPNKLEVYKDPIEGSKIRLI